MRIQNYNNYNKTNRANKSKTWPQQQAYHKENDEIQENQNSPKIEGPTKQHFQGSRVQKGSSFSA